MKREKYKDSLSKKTVEELVEIILRKDDKDREKNKQMHNLERKINLLKSNVKELTENADTFNKYYKDISTEAHNLEINCQYITSKYNKALTQNTLLRIIIALLGAIAIIELLIITI